MGHSCNLLRATERPGRVTAVHAARRVFGYRLRWRFDMRTRFSPLNCLLILIAIVTLATIATVCYDGTANAATQSTGYREEFGLGGQVISNPVAATFLTVPAGATHAWVTVWSKPACYGYDAAAPTSASGGKWPAGFVAKLDNDRLQLQALRVINCSEGATEFRVYYSRSRRNQD